MTDDSEAYHQENALSESWANISDAGNSLDDELQSETTDGASLIDNNGPDDVHSLDEHASDAASQDACSERDMGQDSPWNESLEDSTKTVAPTSVAPLTCLPSKRIPIPTFDEIGAGGEEVSQIINIFTPEEAQKIAGRPGGGHSGSQVFSSVYMTISAKTLDLDRPFRVLYTGGATGRAEILAKIGDALVAGSRSRKHRLQLGSSLYHVLPSPVETGSFSENPELIPIRTQITVDDCTTAASIKHDEAPDQIFLSLKNGSLYSSRWTGADFELSSGSDWTQPDLAVFFVTHDDHPVLRQRHQLVHQFVTRHHTASLVVSEATDWTSNFDYLPLDIRSPHFRIESEIQNIFGQPNAVGQLPIDRKTFQSLDPEQLSKNLAFCCHRAEDQESVDSLSSLLLSSHCNHAGEAGKSSSRKRLDDYHSSSHGIWYGIWRDPAQRRKVMMLAAGAIVAVFATLAVTIPVTMVAYLLSYDSVSSETAPSTAWRLQPASLVAAMHKDTAVLQAATTTATPTSNLVPRSVATLFGSSDLTEVMTNESFKAANHSKNFQVHSIGDGHLIVKTPRGFKRRNKASAFDVVVSRKEQRVESAVAPLFEGIYQVRIEGGEGYGLLNVTIRLPRSSVTERYEVDLGNQWLKVAGWQKATEVVSEQVRDDLERARGAVSLAYDQALGFLQSRMKGVSGRAAQQAAGFWRQSSSFLQGGASTFTARLSRLRRVTDHGRQEIHEIVRSGTDLACCLLAGTGHRVTTYSRIAFESFLAVPSQAAQRMQDVRPSVEFSKVKVKMGEYRRSEYLAKAQERAKQLASDASGSLRREAAVSDKTARVRDRDRDRDRDQDQIVLLGARR